MEVCTGEAGRRGADNIVATGVLVCEGGGNVACAGGGSRAVMVQYS